MKIKFPESLKPGIRPLPPKVYRDNPYIIVATWFGSGRLKPASGTWGTIAAVPFGVVIAHYGGMMGLALAAFVLFLIGTAAADYYGRESGTVDDHAIVVDEVVGMWIAALPAQDNAILWVIAFILFRVFDIFKPWPASFFDNRSKNGFDVMADDVVAGFYAMLGVAGAAFPFLARGLM